MKRGKQVSRAIIDPLAITVARCLRHWHMKVLKGLGNKKYLITYSKILQIASTADQLASKINLETPQLVDKKFLFSWIWPTKSSKNNFFRSARCFLPSHIQQHKWNNCFIKNAHKISRILSDFICKNKRFSACFNCEQTRTVQSEL